MSLSGNVMCESYVQVCCLKMYEDHVLYLLQVTLHVRTICSHVISTNAFTSSLCVMGSMTALITQMNKLTYAKVGKPMKYYFQLQISLL